MYYKGRHYEQRYAYKMRTMRMKAIGISFQCTRKCNLLHCHSDLRNGFCVMKEIYHLKKTNSVYSEFHEDHMTMGKDKRWTSEGSSVRREFFFNLCKPESKRTPQRNLSRFYVSLFFVLFFH